MINAYRLVKPKWSENAFDGQGAKRYGGRWNSGGQACVYLTDSISLGLLEIMAHVNDYAILKHYQVFALQFEADDLLRLSEKTLPMDWRVYPAPLSTAEIGDQWLATKASAVLAVPGVIAPHEYNYLLNPAHEKFAQIVDTAKAINFEADARIMHK